MHMHHGHRDPARSVGTTIHPVLGLTRAQRRRPKSKGGTVPNYGGNQPYTNPERWRIKADRTARRDERKASA